MLFVWLNIRFPVGHGNCLVPIAMLRKKILILDDAGFSKVCSAILESAGYSTEIASEHADDLASGLSSREYGLVITSYPYGSFLFGEIQKRNIPTLLLATHIDIDLMHILQGLKDTYCMIKPLDYNKFTRIISRMLAGDYRIEGGYNIV